MSGPTCPADILEAIEGGEITLEQLRRLIAWEAGLAGLSYEEAVNMVRRGKRIDEPPDLEMLIGMLPEEE